MDRTAFLQLSDACLTRVAEWADAFDPDEVEATVSDGVLTLEFPGRVRYVLNRQTAASQMWFAAGAEAWHYDWDEARAAWIGDRDGHELLERIAAVVSARIGRRVAL